MNIRVPYGMSVHDHEEINAIIKTLNTSTQMGVNVRLFEKKIRKLFLKKFGLMTNSGTSALFLAIESLSLPANSEVITPVLTFATTISCIVKNNLVPVFTDVKKSTYCIDEDKIEKLITKRTKALCIPNLIGNLPNWNKIRNISKKYGLIVIEDSADTLAATFRKKSTGFFSDISTTSFYGSHIINCAGNGGMVCFNDSKYYIKAKLLRSWGRNSSLFDDSEKIENRFNVKIEKMPYDAKFIFSEIGYNYEPSEIGASFGLVQLKKLKKNIKLREKIFKSHNIFFEKYNDFFILPYQNKETKTCWLAYPLIIKPNKKFDRKKIQIYLEKKNIQTRVIFTGNVLKQPGFKKIIHKKDPSGFSNANNVMENGFMIALHHGLNHDMLNHMYKTFENFFKNL
jgi:CDP-6-deoxy-D-xylo-4-hexulose-3-dehydrase